MSRELDAQVAEKVMGITNVHRAERGEWLQIEMDFALVGELVYWGDKGLTRLPYYSTDIAAAWEVVEKMNKEMYDVTLFMRDGKWICGWENIDDQWYEMESDTAQEAICRAALKVKEAEVTKPKQSKNKAAKLYQPDIF